VRARGRTDCIVAARRAATKRHRADFGTQHLNRVTHPQMMVILGAKPEGSPGQRAETVSSAMQTLQQREENTHSQVGWEGRLHASNDRRAIRRTS